MKDEIPLILYYRILLRHLSNILIIFFVQFIKSREKVYALLEKTCPKFSIDFVILISTIIGDDIEGKVYADEFSFMCQNVFLLYRLSVLAWDYT